MDKRAYGMLLGLAGAALTIWFARRRRRDEDMWVAPRPEGTPPHGDPLIEGLQ